MANNKDFKVKNGIKPTVYHEAVGTVTSGSTSYDLANASYDNVSKSLSAQNASPMGLYFTDDGTQMFMVGASADEVNQYSLSTAWDLNTLTYVRVLALAETIPSGIFFKDDGYKMYIVGYGLDNVYEHTLTTAWDISSGTITHTEDISSVDSVPFGLFFKPDGTKMYFSAASNSKLAEYDLSTAWDLSTVSFNQYSPSIVSNARQPFFTSDGLKVFIPNNGTDVVTEYSLSTAWDVSTLSYVREFDVSSNEANPYVAAFKSDGTKMYVTGGSTATIYQYSTSQTTATLDLSTGSVFEITPTSDIQIGLSNPADSGTVSAATLLLDGNSNTFDIANGSYDSVSFSTSTQTGSLRDIAFKPDGTKMYVVSSSNNYAYQYSLSTAWDVSTASYDSVFINVSSKETILSSLTFSSDGTKVYFAGPEFDSIHQYNLSTAWDLNTDSFAQSFSASGTVNLYCVRFSSDGTKMYLGQYSATNIYQYSLSTAWDISTASYDSVTLALRSGTTAYGFDFNDDGTAIYVCSNSIDSIYRMDLSTAWDISTGTDSNVTFSVTSQDTNPTYVRFKPDGTKMYVSGDVNTRVFQYSTESGITVTYDPDLQWGGGTAPDSPAANETDVLTFTTRDGGTTYQAAIAIDGAA